MNSKKQELFDRLRKTTDIIWENPMTSAKVILILEELVSSLEQIAADLATNSDEYMARELDEIISAYST